jgi:hypothetical protein
VACGDQLQELVVLPHSLQNYILIHGGTRVNNDLSKGLEATTPIEGYRATVAVVGRTAVGGERLDFRI